MIFEAPVKHFPAGTTTDELKKSGAPSPFDRYLRRETGAMEKALGPPEPKAFGLFSTLKSRFSASTKLLESKSSTVSQKMSEVATSPLKMKL
ncbi:uncharacterized protein CELE_F07G6.8 [Caenorhabditis elegans]|uniref:Uncharacterized protein n=1 Tax=Caenorhabditis elegans TaxID=6239 RepID=Q19170_CAEEL|nr:Uncharacterized protein CELE_F07G6.8 [Caenorhabditis elegans]CCD66890.1 Uncharacterized protein CELE_F07G6.8 [Caenorhabditis elegans]|eukprot:NP_508316.1 Uncharacterized protein CELE_F07G6.8 [Caenorhabditis elegans]